jgi:hypothetical protein
VACGSLTPSSSNAYQACGFGVSNGSNSFVNWSSLVSSLGITPVQFALYYYELSGVESLRGHGLYSLTFGSGLQAGTIAIAYSCASAGNCAITPLTEAGIVVPEPASRSLVAGSMLALAALALRRRRQHRRAG